MMRISLRGLQRRVHLPDQFISRHFSATQHFLNRVEGKWLTKLCDDEKLYVYGHKVGTKHTVVHHTLNSRKPITPDIMRSTLNHLIRQFPMYHLTIKERDDDLWFFQPDSDPELDFKIREIGTPKDEAIQDLYRPFDETNGPMARFELVPADEKSLCLFPHLKSTHPYQYDLFECPHHATGDGFCFAVQTYHLLNILGTLLEGKEWSDNSKVGEHTCKEEWSYLYQHCAQELRENPRELEQMKNDILRANKQPLLLEAFPPPKDEVPGTRFIMTVFDEALVKRFLGLCKERGITFGNGFQMVIMTALIELVQDAGLDKEFYDISVLYTVDLRRYMKRKETPIFGLHMKKMTSVFNIERNVRADFWENCIKVQQINKDHLNNKSLIKQEVIRQEHLPYVAPEDFYKSKPEVTLDFQFNNTANMNQMDHSSQVTYSNLGNYFQVHQSNYPFHCQLVTLKGKVISVLDYATDLVEDQTASLLSEKIKHILEYFSK